MIHATTKLFLLIALLPAFAIAQSSGTKKTASTKPAKSSSAKTPAATNTTPPVLLPSKEEIDTGLKRTFGYDPAISWTIYDIKPAAIPGLVDVLVSMNKQNPVHLYVSPDRQYAVAGEIIPFGPNPFAPAREKLKAADGPTQGAAKPVIEIVEFSDLECPHCKKAAPILDKLVTDFPQVQLTFQQFPLPATIHPWALKAAEYADCAAQHDKAAFWKYVDSIFENQGSIAAATADDKLKELATASGLDATKIASCAVTPETEARVNKSLQFGKSLDINQTPTVFINGRRVLGIGDIPYDQLKNLVQFEIDHAGK
ncbi:MAG TPA: thioredoxin domain-containing protein [Candidatus Angelobacter sp.]|nr:thioredoxin domain-containing protein [Candidatus Angelobacter sp.]